MSPAGRLKKDAVDLWVELAGIRLQDGWREEILAPILPGEPQLLSDGCTEERHPHISSSICHYLPRDSSFSKSIQIRITCANVHTCAHQKAESRGSWQHTGHHQSAHALQACGGTDTTGGKGDEAQLCRLDSRQIAKKVVSRRAWATVGLVNGME